jgi:cobalt/nickel transport protein
MIRKQRNYCAAATLTGIFIFCPLSPAIDDCQAHFGMVIPSQPLATQQDKTTTITLSFSHPFELIGMDLNKPDKFYVVADEQSTDLLTTLQPAPVMNRNGWSTQYSFTRPGVYQFVMEPAPYWEPAEDLSIIHYTKVIVPAYGEDQGWDTPLGLPTEIVPLSRPFGNYAGNSFTGQVLVGGQPAGGAEVEVEFYNEKNLFSSPTDYHITQLVKADSSGIFSFSCPLAGWWGFAALSEADYTLKNPSGEDKGVELGAVLWVYFDDIKRNPAP